MRRGPHLTMASSRRYPPLNMNRGREGLLPAIDIGMGGPRPTKCSSRHARSLRNSWSCRSSICSSNSAGPYSSSPLSRPRRVRRCVSTMRPTTLERPPPRHSRMPSRKNKDYKRASSQTPTRRSPPATARTSPWPSRLQRRRQSWRSAGRRRSRKHDPPLGSPSIPEKTPPTEPPTLSRRYGKPGKRGARDT